MHGIRRRALGALVGAGAGIVAVALAAACGSFDGADAPSDEPPEAAAPDGSLPVEDARTADGEAPDEPCPHVAAPACAPGGVANACAIVTLYTPPKTPLGSYAFGITTDDRNVYWIQQDEDANGPPNIYDGAGEGKILRIAKRDAGGQADVLATGQTRATQIVREGDGLYWVAQDDDAQWHLFGVPAACKAPCTPEALMDLPDQVFAGLLRKGPGVLVGRMGDGRLVTMDLSSDIPTTVDAPAIYPSMAVMSGALALGAAKAPKGARADVVTFYPFDGGAPWAVPLPDAGSATKDPGFVFLASNCEELAGARAGAGSTVAYTLAASGGAFEEGPVLHPSGVFAAAADEGYFYFAGLDGLGVRALAVGGNEVTTISSAAGASGLAVDDDGLYWGEHVHKDQTPSATVRMMEKR